jgi:hypothetical protein
VAMSARRVVPPARRLSFQRQSRLFDTLSAARIGSLL